MLMLFTNAECIGDQEKKEVGQLNYPLTKTGEIEAKNIAENNHGYKFDMVFAADSEQCHETLRHLIVNIDTLENYVRTEAFRGRSGGIIEGLSYSNIHKLYAPKVYKLWDRDYHIPTPMGESYYELERRCIPFFEEEIVPLLDDNKNVLICVPTTVVRIIIGYIKKLSEAETLTIIIQHAIPYVLHGTITKD